MRIGIISDIHQDLDNLSKAIKHFEQLNCDKIWCLGDILGYNKYYKPFFSNNNANKCVDIVRMNCALVILGNHDLHAIERFPEISPGFNYPDNWFLITTAMRRVLSSSQLWSYETDTVAELSKQNLEFLYYLKEFEIFDTPRIKILASHFIYPNITGSIKGFITHPTDCYSHFHFMELQGADFSFVGHGHVEGVCFVSERKLRFRGFGVYSIRKKHKMVILPPLAKSNRLYGYVVYDDKKHRLEVYRLV